MRVHRLAAFAIVCFTLAAGCGSWADGLACPPEGCAWTPAEWQRLTSLADRPVGRSAGLPPLPDDPSNRWANDREAARLGQIFFFDTGFSGPARQMDSLRRPTTLGRAPVGQPTELSCASCHDPLRGGTDVSSRPGHVSVGAGVTDVNALPTLNAARRRTLFWNGRMDSSWGLNALVAEGETTMNGTRLQVAHRLADRYGDAVQEVFGEVLPAGWRTRAAALPARGKPGRGCMAGDPGEPEQDAFDCLPRPDQDLADLLLVVWAKALAAYGRLLESRDSPFDRFVAEGPDSRHLSESAKRGARLFVGKASCIDCHSGPLLTDEGFHNVGVPQTGAGVPTPAECVADSPCDCVAGKACLPWGRWNGLSWQQDTATSWQALLTRHRDDGTAAPSPVPPTDEGLKGAWRTPSLRDVDLTAPYMHDGAYGSLEEVLEHYNSGGRGGAGAAVGTPSVKLKPLVLRAEEIADLVAFLKSLTGAQVPASLRDPTAGGTGR
jgi:cytochrome c peroxidase